MRAAIPALFPLILSACAGPDDDRDGGADLGPLLPLDVETVQARVLALDALLPGCTAAGAGTPTRLPIAGQGAAGDCGGELVVDWEHGDGDTAYVLDFQSFCVSGGGDAVTLDGVVEGLESGTPSDDGPVIDALELAIPGTLAVAHPGGAIDVQLTRLRADYGVPAAWQPGTPTADAPDRTRVDDLIFAFPGTDHPDMRFTELEAERVGAVPELTVVDGAVVLGEEGHVRIRTAPGAPVSVDGLDGLTGTVEILGADDAVLEIEVGAAGPLGFTGRIDGAELPVTMDCAEALPPGLQIYAALLSALPIH